VQIYEVGEQDGRPFFSLELVDGGSLDRRVRGTPQAPRPAAGFVAVLARAMHAAHQAGVVHRDLKPANVLLSLKPDAAPATGPEDEGERPLEAFEPKITDFGLAKRLDGEGEHTQSGAVMGTPSYMAPEQAEGRISAIGPRTDVYALAAILYELLTGRPPFKAATRGETIEQVRTQEPVPPSRLQAKLPRDLEFDPETLQLTFAKAFDCLNAANPNVVDPAKLDKLANQWHDYIMLASTESEQLFTEMAKAQAELKSSKTLPKPSDAPAPR